MLQLQVIALNSNVLSKLLTYSALLQKRFSSNIKMGWKPASNRRRVAQLLQENNTSESRMSTSDISNNLNQNLYRRRNAITHLCFPSNSVIQQVADTLWRLGDELEMLERRVHSRARTQNTDWKVCNELGDNSQ